jgi:hypothetical protein
MKTLDVGDEGTSAFTTRTTSYREEEGLSYFIMHDKYVFRQDYTAEHDPFITSAITKVLPCLTVRGSREEQCLTIYYIHNYIFV